MSELCPLCELRRACAETAVPRVLCPSFEPDRFEQVRLECIDTALRVARDDAAQDYREVVASLQRHDTRRRPTTPAERDAVAADVMRRGAM